MAVTMKVLTPASGAYEPRILSGEGVRRPENGDRGEIQWLGGETIIVTDELAVLYQASGQAERCGEQRECAIAGGSETAVISNQRRKGRRG